MIILTPVNQKVGTKLIYHKINRLSNACTGGNNRGCGHGHFTNMYVQQEIRVNASFVDDRH